MTPTHHDEPGEGPELRGIGLDQVGLALMEFTVKLGILMTRVPLIGTIASLTTAGQLWIHPLVAVVPARRLLSWHMRLDEVVQDIVKSLNIHIHIVTGQLTTPVNVTQCFGKCRQVSRRFPFLKSNFVGLESLCGIC